MEPSGKGWPLPGMPALYAWIMVGLATITLSTSSVRAEEATAQSSYPPEVRERDSARRFQRVLVLRVECRDDEDDEHCRGYRTDGKAADTFHGGACFYLLFLLLLCNRFRRKFRQGVFSFTKKFSKPDQPASRTIAIRPEVAGVKQLDQGIDDTFVSGAR
jgi:hypothetical protein